MSPKVFKAFAEILSKFYASNCPSAALEVGAAEWNLLSISCFKTSRKVALNAQKLKKIPPEMAGYQIVVGNSNSLEFADQEFDCVMSSSVLEHDKYFWKSVEEIYRVLKPGGIFIVGVPIYMTLPIDYMNTTLTFKRHGIAYNADFYRFSEQAVREVILEKFTLYESILVRKYPNPYLVMSGVKN
jgi:SAM-dependent methyltransferase